MKRIVLLIFLVMLTVNVYLAETPKYNVLTVSSPEPFSDIETGSRLTIEGLVQRSDGYIPEKGEVKIELQGVIVYPEINDSGEYLGYIYLQDNVGESEETIYVSVEDSEGIINSTSITINSKPKLFLKELAMTKDVYGENEVIEINFVVKDKLENYIENALISATLDENTFDIIQNGGGSYTIKLLVPQGMEEGSAEIHINCGKEGYVSADPHIQEVLIGGTHILVNIEDTDGNSVDKVGKGKEYTLSGSVYIYGYDNEPGKLEIYDGSEVLFYEQEVYVVGNEWSERIEIPLDINSSYVNIKFSLLNEVVEKTFSIADEEKIIEIKEVGYTEDKDYIYVSIRGLDTNTIEFINFVLRIENEKEFIEVTKSITIDKYSEVIEFDKISKEVLDVGLREGTVEALDVKGEVVNSYNFEIENDKLVQDQTILTANIGDFGVNRFYDDEKLVPRLVVIKGNKYEAQKDFVGIWKSDNFPQLVKPETKIVEDLFNKEVKTVLFSGISKDSLKEDGYFYVVSVETENRTQKILKESGVRTTLMDLKEDNKEQLVITKEFGEKVSYELQDLETKQIVKNGSFAEEEFIIEKSELNNGWYIIYLTIGRDVYTREFNVNNVSSLTCESKVLQEGAGLLRLETVVTNSGVVGTYYLMYEVDDSSTKIERTIPFFINKDEGTKRVVNVIDISDLSPGDKKVKVSLLDKEEEVTSNSVDFNINDEPEIVLKKASFDGEKISIELEKRNNEYFIMEEYTFGINKDSKVLLDTSEKVVEGDTIYTRQLFEFKGYDYLITEFTMKDDRGDLIAEILVEYYPDKIWSLDITDWVNDVGSVEEGTYSKNLEIKIEGDEGIILKNLGIFYKEIPKTKTIKVGDKQLYNVIDSDGGITNIRNIGLGSYKLSFFFEGIALEYKKKTSGEIINEEYSLKFKNNAKEEVTSLYYWGNSRLKLKDEYKGIDVSENGDRRFIEVTLPAGGSITIETAVQGVSLVAAATYEKAKSYFRVGLVIFILGIVALIYRGYKRKQKAIDEAYITMFPKDDGVEEQSTKSNTKTFKNKERTSKLGGLKSWTRKLGTIRLPGRRSTQYEEKIVLRTRSNKRQKNS